MTWGRKAAGSLDRVSGWLTDLDPRTWRRWWIGLALVLGAFRTWNARHHSNPGSISFMDLADAVLAGEWQDLINGYWQPVYALLLAGARLVIPVSAYWEATLLHLVNFGAYAGSLLAFTYFWNGLIRLQASRAGSGESGTGRPLPESLMLALGYAWFIWSSLTLIAIRHATPDLLVALIAYVVAGFTVRIRGGDAGWLISALLGLVLGIGYLVKAIWFPLGLVVVGVMCFALSGPGPSRLRRTALALFVFLAVSSSLIVPLSMVKGRPTFSDVGKLTHAWFTNGVTRYAHWQGEPPGRGVPMHPTRQLHERPALFEFAEPLPGTHPIWFDPSYWFEGLELSVYPGRQLAGLLESAAVFFELVRDMQPELLLLVILAALGPLAWSRPLALDVLSLAAPCGAVFLMYALVHTETRFLGAFVVIMAGAALLPLRIVPERLPKRLLGLSVAAVVLMIGLRVAVDSLRAVSNQSAEFWDNPQWQIAEDLRSAGLDEGDWVGSMGAGFGFYWARLARVRIVAEIPDASVPDYWYASDSTKAAVLDVFRAAGVKALVSRAPPPEGRGAGWRRVAGGPEHVIFLDQD